LLHEEELKDSAVAWKFECNRAVGKSCVSGGTAGCYYFTDQRRMGIIAFSGLWKTGKSFNLLILKSARTQVTHTP
jgi:tryptophan 2,3-dioxygenase